MPARYDSGGLAQSAVLATLGRAGPSSRADLARELGISPATVTQVIRRLREQGMVEELSHEPSRGGRPAQLVGIVAAAAHAVGVKVAADHLTVVDAQLDGTIVESHTFPFDATAPGTPARLTVALAPLLDDGSQVPLLGVGVCVPGVVDAPHNGRVDSPTLGWDGAELGRHLRGAFGLPVLVENDVKALAVAEQLFGRGRRHRDFLVLTIGRGIGAAVISDGELVRGAHGAAGEIAHIRVTDDPVPCRCGQLGCLDALIGEQALVARAGEAGIRGRSVGIERLHQLADRRHPAALELFAQAGRLLAGPVSGLVSGADPEIIIVLGEGAGGWQHWQDGFSTELARRLSLPAARPAVEVEYWDDTRWAQGAAALMLAIPFHAASAAGPQSPVVLARLTAPTTTSP